MSETRADWEAAARGAGWLPPDEVELKVWHARNLNRGSCRWCGSRRIPQPGQQQRPHKPYCRFYDGPVTHGFSTGHLGTFDYWINCTCGRSYPERGTDGNKQECPDRELTWRRPEAPDLLAPTLA